MHMLLTGSVLALASFAQDHSHSHGPELGKVAFQTTCNSTANARFTEGLGWLHSFEYEQAEASFAQAAAADPGCAIAHWGVAMSKYHPLWAPPTAKELEQAAAALAAAKAVGAKSKREQDFIAALEVFYRDAGRLDHKTRVLAYEVAMEKLHASYPDDHEAAVFYALSLAASGLQDKDPEFAKEKQAAAILTRVLAAEPEHPGVAHYVIHSFDYPPLAKLALPAALGYAGIAPASAHAQHMPSHIFTRLGMWEEAIESNLKSAAAAKAYAKSKGMAGAWEAQLHAMDYLAYAYLQLGRDGDALKLLTELNEIKHADPPALQIAYAATAIPARLVLERRRWREAAALELHENVRGFAPLANFQWAGAHIHFARAIGAARSGNSGAARAELAKLKEAEEAIAVPPGAYDWRTQVSIERQIAEGWLAHAEGRNGEAVRLMRAAADLDDATEKHPVTPGALLPAREQLGELLIALGRPAEALTAYEASLKRAPRRLAGLYGAARAARLAGVRKSATRYYREIAELTRGGDATRPEATEARRYYSASVPKVRR
jgi:tetratricopeptide (TPR) repeat protein